MYDEDKLSLMVCAIGVNFASALPQYSYLFSEIMGEISTFDVVKIRIIKKYKMKLNLGIIGVGTVGSGVLSIIESRKEWLQEHYQVELNIATIVAKTPENLAEFPQYRGTTNAIEMINDPAIDVVVELAGGYELPFSWISKALENGKHVVTANKALLAKYGHKLFPAAAKNNLSLKFEAAVAGGIPIIKAIQESLSGNEILSLYGIINGTCNYIVSEMDAKGLDFDTVLKEAQNKGFAEADPTFDVDGIDACHKLAILSTIAERALVPFEKVPCEGIRNIEAIDLQIVDEMGYLIKLLGIYRKVGNKADVRVHPCILPKDHLLANVNGVLNAIYLETDRLGPALFTGAGAGMFPTASAVVADIIDIALGIKSGVTNPMKMDYFSEEKTAVLMSSDEIEAKYYLRIISEDRKGVLAKITKILSDSDISIESVVQKPSESGRQATIVVVTHKAIEVNLKKAVNEIDCLEEIAKDTQFIRFV